MEIQLIINDSDSPETYEEAVKSDENKNWKKAKDGEMNSLKENQTWELTDPPEEARRSHVMGLQNQKISK